MSTTQPIRNEKELYDFKNYYKEIIPRPRNYALIILGLNTALRISDILLLQYKDIYDIKKKCFKEHIEIIEKKTKKPNSILLNCEIKKALACCIPANVDNSDYVFSSKKYKEQPLSRYQAFRIIKDAASYAGLSEHISCHSLRKTFGYHAWKQGIPPAVIMSIYNHSSFQITKKYLCIEQDDRDAVFNTIKL